MFKKPVVRRIIELLTKNLSDREIARALHASRNTISVVRERLSRCMIPTEQLLAMPSSELYEMFFPDHFTEKKEYTSIDFGYIHSELKKVGVTLKLLWEEYSEKCKGSGTAACSYSTFTRAYAKYTFRREYTSYVVHKPGVTAEVDWSGPTMTYTDRNTGTSKKAYLFVATLPYSQYSYVEATENMNENTWLLCHVNMFSYFGGVPLKITCDNLKTGVISHPRSGEIVLNESYLTLAEYYGVAIMPAGVKKPKHKASVEGTIGKIATAVIAKLRNEKFYSIEGINNAIKHILNSFNEAHFQKREGSRRIVFETEEKSFLKILPPIPYEVSDWLYGCSVNNASHVWFKKGQYSVPGKYIGKKVDLRYTSKDLFIYYNREMIATHKLLPAGIKNGKRTDPAHLPYPEFKHATPENALQTAAEFGTGVKGVVIQMLERAKVREQALPDIAALFRLSRNHKAEDIDTACRKALSRHRYPTVADVRKYLKNIQKNDVVSVKNEGIVRGADYYRKAGNINEL